MIRTFIILFYTPGSSKTNIFQVCLAKLAWTILKVPDLKSDSD